ncbi:MAG TPA: tetratricopeptide repeat protein [Acidobacteriota bacterium]|nr:tetratricopeptide repeat protein [Acidobacteriota bacterium]
MAKNSAHLLGWVRLAPLLLLALAVWVHRESQNEVWLQVQRAKECWREGRPQQAIRIYQSIYERYPDSRYTPEVLWELATLHYLQGESLEWAAHYFGILGGHYPAHALAAKALFRQAEIYEKDLDDNRRAVQIWESLLHMPGLSPQQRSRTLLRLASVYYKTEQFQAAQERLDALLEQTQEGETAQQARLLSGTIAQLQSRYEQSVDLLSEALRHPECPDCRLQAQLALIQSYEFLDRLPQAIEVARQLPTDNYPPAMKDDLIERLQDKLRLDR